MRDGGSFFQKLRITFTQRACECDQAFRELRRVRVETIQLSVSINRLFVVGEMRSGIGAEKFIRQRVEYARLVILRLDFATLARLIEICAQFIAARQVREELVSDLARFKVVFGHQVPPLKQALMCAVELQQALHEIQIVWKALMCQRVETQIKLRIEVGSGSVCVCS